MTGAALPEVDAITGRLMSIQSAYQNGAAQALCGLIAEAGPERDESAALVLLMLPGLLLAGDALLSARVMGKDESDAFRGLRMVHRMPSPSPAWREVLRPLSARRHGERYRPFASRRAPAETLTFHLEGLQEQYAADLGIHPVSSRLQIWLADPRTFAPGAGAPMSEGMLEAAVGAVAEGWRQAGWEMTADDVASVRTEVADTARVLAAQLRHVWRHRRSLPRDLWSPTLFHPLHRVMAWAVLQNGGEVTAFDHGCSSGLWDDWGQVFGEFDLCSRFVTFGTDMAEGLRANAHPRIRARPDHMPDLVATRLPAHDAPRPRQTLQDVDVLYVPTMFHQFAHLPPLFPHAVYQDWQRRMLSELQRRGYSLAMKLHPEGRIAMPAAVTDGLDVPALFDRFEDLDTGDAVLVFDVPSTSAFRSALLGTAPIVVVEAPRLPIGGAARHALEHRVAFVPADMDSAGRVQVDWAVFEDALAKAPARRHGGAAVAGYFSVASG